MAGDTEFNIQAPQRHQQAPIGTDNKIQVTLQDFCTHTYTVTIYYFPFESDGSRVLDGRSVTFPVSGSFTARMPVDTTELGDGTTPFNRFIEVVDNESNDIQSYSFRATFQSSSASSSSGSKSNGHEIAKFCKPGQVVPHAVTMKLGSKVTRGTCSKCGDLNQPAGLLFEAGCWFSRPIAFCGRDMPPGYWVLTRNSTTAWTLVLKQATKVLATYVAKTKRLDCSLPITLERKGAGSKVCQAWPKSISISPAQ